ncbi:heat shock protein DnaJ domain protein [Nitzschia inconspicua]|uniref:Heat shock protein DnaJ domain protein n=1 Tax=Nitzschia inconspicua TaxID=303405 RepID=A0A9K3PBC3_9STRA|nr:heat shock protein DnaJ domain protein [Nitzschia inconspicua]
MLSTAIPCRRQAVSQRRTVVGFLILLAVSLCSIVPVHAIRRSAQNNRKSYYDILGVPKTAGEKEIKKAYRKLAIQHHPDKGGNEETFKEISKAYQTLSNPDEKKIYDQYGEAGLEMGAGPNAGSYAFGGGNPFGAAGGNPFQEYFSTQGSGGPGGFRTETFSFGGGNGSDSSNVNIDLSEILRQMMGGEPTKGRGGIGDPFQQRHSTSSSASPTYTHPVRCTLEDLAMGTTKKMKTTFKGEERIYTIPIKPGWKAGTKVTYQGKQHGPHRSPTMIFEIEEIPHKFLKRKGDDLHFVCWIDETQTKGGIQIGVPLPTGETYTRKIPKTATTEEDGSDAPVLSNGEKLVIPNKGMPIKGGPERGDLVIEFRCVVLGITPPDNELADRIQQNVTHAVVVADNMDHDDVVFVLDDDRFADMRIQWRSDYTLAMDNCDITDDGSDNDTTEGRLTMLLSAFIDGDTTSPDDVVAAVQTEIAAAAAKNFHVEVWGTAGAPLPMRPLEGYETHIVLDPAHTSHDTFWMKQARKAMQQYGLVVQPKLFSQEVVTKFRAIVNAAINDIEEQLAKYRPDLVVGGDVLSFREIASRKNQRFDLRLDVTSDGAGDASEHLPAVALTRQLVEESPSIQEFLYEALDLTGNDSEATKRNVFDQLDFDISVVYSKPGAVAQGWHADGSHRPGLSTAWNTDDVADFNVGTPPYAICLFVPLIDLNECVGYTQFWPGSHVHRQLAGLGPFAQVTQSVWNSSSCRAGDGVWYDYRLMHQGMPHQMDSSVQVRPILQVIFKQRWYVERANYGVESVMTP